MAGGDSAATWIDENLTEALGLLFPDLTKRNLILQRRSSAAVRRPARFLVESAGRGRSCRSATTPTNNSGMHRREKHIPTTLDTSKDLPYETASFGDWRQKVKLASPPVSGARNHPLLFLAA
jgi:hypothetical protein